MRASQSQLPGWIAAKQRRVANVFADSVERAVAGLPHDRQFAGAIQPGLRGQAGAQAVAGIPGSIQADPARRPFDDQSHRVAVESLAGNLSMAVDLPEDGAAPDAGG